MRVEMMICLTHELEIEKFGLSSYVPYPHTFELQTRNIAENPQRHTHQLHRRADGPYTGQKAVNIQQSIPRSPLSLVHTMDANRSQPSVNLAHAQDNKLLPLMLVTSLTCYRGLVY